MTREQENHLSFIIYHNFWKIHGRYGTQAEDRLQVEFLTASNRDDPTGTASV